MASAGRGDGDGVIGEWIPVRSAGVYAGYSGGKTGGTRIQSSSPVSTVI